MGIKLVNGKTTRTYVKGRTTKNKNKGFKRTHRRCPHGHCWICGWDPRTKGWKKTQQRKDFKFDILPFIEMVLKMKYCKDCGKKDLPWWEVRCVSCKTKNTIKRKYKRRHEHRMKMVKKMKFGYDIK